MPRSKSTIDVVIIDDSDLVRTLLESFLNASPRTSVTATASCGLDGIELVLRHRPDVAIIDVQMPDIDGFAVATEVLRHWPTAKIIINSAEERSPAPNVAGIAAYVTKAMRPRELHATVLAVADTTQRPRNEFGRSA